MLNILERFDLKAKGLLTAPALHLQIEAMRRAYLDRARHLGDPDFVEVPVARLTSKEHAQAGRGVDRSGQGVEQRRARQGHRHGPDRAEPDETTHFSVIDRDGMAVTNTYTLEGGFGSHVVVKGAGFLLNNEMGDFNRKPGETNVDRRHRHAGQPDRARQADAQLDDADDGASRMAGWCCHRLARRADDHQHGLRDRARRHGVRVERPSGGRPGRACIISGCPIAPRSKKARCPRRSLGDSCARMGHDVRAQARQGDAHSIWVAPDGTPYGVPRQAHARLEGLGARKV